MIFLSLVLGIVVGAVLMSGYRDALDDIRWWREHHQHLSHGCDH